MTDFQTKKYRFIVTAAILTICCLLDYYKTCLPIRITLLTSMFCFGYAAIEFLSPETQKNKENELQIKKKEEADAKKGIRPGDILITCNQHGKVRLSVEDCKIQTHQGRCYCPLCGRIPNAIIRLECS